MSWSVQAVGKSDKVAEAIEAQFAGLSKCSEPEETVKQSVRAAVAASLAAQIPATAVKVSASGSQSSYRDHKDAPVRVQNTVSVSIEPLWGFVE